MSFVSSKGNILCRLINIELYKIFAIINRAIKGLHCILIVPPSPKSQTRTQSEVMLPLSQQACGEKAGVSNYEAYYSGNLN